MYICRDEGPRYRNWAVGSARGRQITWGQISTSEGIQINGPWKRPDHNEQETFSKDFRHTDVFRGGLKFDHPSRIGQQAIVLERINIREGWDKRELWNIWEENCYHRIEYSVSNLLTALMWKWYLTNNFQPYSYPQRLQKCVDGTSIKKTSNLIYMWRADMKEREET